MDRRRYVPSPKDSKSGPCSPPPAAGVFGTSPTTTQTLPITFQQKELRIQKVPINLRALEPNRYLPPATISQIQLGLNQIMSGMTAPPPQALTNYNLLLRKIVFNSSVSAAAPSSSTTPSPPCSSRATPPSPA